MPDRFTKQKRSEIMSKIRSKGTKIELTMKKALEEAGIEFEYQPRMFGRPDFLVFPKIAIFCDSSFWHGRNWKSLKRQLPSAYWQNHIRENIKRDKLVNTELSRSRYVVMRFWDDDIEKNLHCCVEKIRRNISESQM